MPRMKIGVFSDTHNDVRAAWRALDCLLGEKVAHLVHCGDVGEDVLDVISATCQAHDLQAHVAIGNCDRHLIADARFRPHPAGVVLGEMLAFTLRELRCLVIHGDRAELFAAVVFSGEYDYIFTGHTHAPASWREGRTRCLNPGAAFRSRQGPETVAVLDVNTGATEWLPLRK